MDLRLPSAYAGDEALSKLLEELRCPMPLHQLKALIYGALAATDHVSPAEILNCLWVGHKPPVLSEAQFRSLTNNVFALWNDLASLPDGTPYPLTPHDPPGSPKELAAFVQLRQEEMLFFIRGLDLGQTDLDKLPQRALGALQHLGEKNALLEQLAKLLPTATWADLQPAVQKVLHFDQRISEAMTTILTEQKRIRLQSINRRSHPDRPGRNSLCPCGSGRKYKTCCGR